MDDEQDYREFVLAAGASLHRTAFVLTNDRHLAEDLVQQTLLNVWRYWARVRDADDRFAYARRTLFSAYGRMHRRRRVREILGAAAQEQAIDGAQLDERDRLLRALGRLPHTQQAVLILRFYEDLTVEQTAHALGCSIGTVKSRTNRAMEQLRLSPQLNPLEGS